MRIFFGDIRNLEGIIGTFLSQCFCAFKSRLFSNLYIAINNLIMNKSKSLAFFLLLSVFVANGQKHLDTLRVGVIKYKTEEKLLRTYIPMIEYIGSQMGIPAILTIVDGDKLGYELVSGNYDLGIFKPFPYLQSKVHFPELEVFASHLVNNNNYTSGVIVTRKESEILHLNQLKNKRFLFIKPTSTSGYRYPKGIFKEHEIDIDKDFFTYDFSYDHDKAIDALIGNQVDGIAVDLAAFLKRDSLDLRDFNVLSEYKVPHHAYVFSPSLDSMVQENIKEIMFSAHKTPVGRTLFENPLNINRWETQDDKYYNYLRRYLRIMRVKPAIAVTLNLKESAQTNLSMKGDIIDVIKDNLYNELVSTQRFSKKASKNNVTHNVVVTLSMIKDDSFHYQIYLNDDRIAESDIDEEQLINQLPKILTASVLIHDRITTELLSNEEQSFITFGKNDGLNLMNYSFTILDDKNNEEELEVVTMSNLNTSFSRKNLAHGTQVTIKYMTDEHSAAQVSLLDQIDTGNFWRDNFWDKLGLIVGVLLAIFSGFVGWIFNKRKKRRFQNMLTETNLLLKSYYDDKIKLDQKLDELKDTIGNELERGYITENQFLILKQKLDEVELNVRNKKSDTNHDSEEQITEILKDRNIDSSDQ